MIQDSTDDEDDHESYVLHKAVIVSQDRKESCAELTLKFLSIFLMIITFPLSVLIGMRILSEFNRAVVFRMGRLTKKNPRGPGIIFTIPCIDRVGIIDIRTYSFEVNPQEVLTKDAVTVQVDAVVYIRVRSPIDALIQVMNYRDSTRLLAQTTLRNVIGTTRLTELLTSKGELSQKVAKILDKATDAWGIKVERVEVKEISFPEHIQRAMAVEQEAYREALAKIATAQGELDSAQTLKSAADVMAQSKLAIQLRYLQTIATVATKNSQSYIFPLPLNAMRQLMGGNSKPARSTKPKALPNPAEKQFSMAKTGETGGSGGPETSNRSVVTSENRKQSFCEVLLMIFSYIVVIITFPISIFICMRIIAEFRRAVVFRLGRLRKNNPRGPGIIFILPCIDDIGVLDLRTESFDVDPQEVLTKDSVTVTVDAVVYFRILSPVDALVQIADYLDSTQLLAQTTLRNVIGTKQLTELLTAKGILSQEISEILDHATDPWGIKVERVEIKDVRLPLSLQRSLASEAEALREARAKIVAAEGELSASRALKEASDIMSLNPITLQLRYLQTLSLISAERNSTIIFPFPVELMQMGG